MESLEMTGDRILKEIRQQPPAKRLNFAGMQPTSGRDATPAESNETLTFTPKSKKNVLPAGAKRSRQPTARYAPPASAARRRQKAKATSAQQADIDCDEDLNDGSQTEYMHDAHTLVTILV